MRTLGSKQNGNPFRNKIMQGSRWDDLSPEIRDLIVQHGSAMKLQRFFVRIMRFRHTVRVNWLTVRACLGNVVIRELWPYPLVRREWNVEPGSWCHVDAALSLKLVEEAREGLWGMPVRALVSLLNP